MSSKQRTVVEVIAYVQRLAEEGRVESFAFALVLDDGTPPIFGHANPSYVLLGALDQAKAGLNAKLFRQATDAEGFEDESNDH